MAAGGWVGPDGVPPVMTTYEYRAPVDMSAEELFESFAHPESLPEHLPELFTTTPRVDRGGRRLTWSGDDGGRGELTVVDDGPGRSEIAISLDTDRTGDVRQELVEAVAALSHLATSEAEVSATESKDNWY